jgi:hypothetical protein
MDSSNNISLSGDESENMPELENLPQVPINDLGSDQNISLQVEVDHVDIDHADNILSSSLHNNATTASYIESAETAIDFIRSLLTTRILGETGENVFINLPHEHHNPINNIFRGGILERSFAQDKNKYKHVLSEKGNDLIQYIKFSPETFPDQTMCIITRIPFESEDTVAKLPCDHIFDKEAILKWLKQEKASCPVCRYKLDSKEEKVDGDASSISSSSFGINTNMSGGQRFGETPSFFNMDTIRSIEFVQHPTRLMSSAAQRASIDPSGISHPPQRRRFRPSFRLTQLMNMIDHEQEEREEEELQQAILASLQDMSGN